ncbi:MAG TPA: MauE/DoxX family redox-associated membrane protein [Ktedonobacteraceae bacterium]|jgi:peroxiredoxin/uncharacterized membrane protein YphA (DoxX/SURF4 family)
MTAALLLARLLLSIIFLIAGLAKLADLPGSQKALHDFGVPEVLARPLGIVLPIAEIATAVVLISAHWAWYGAIGALVLLLVFIAGISYNLARGRSPDCHCFGQLHSAPVGPSTLVRNAFLALVAALVAWFGRGNINLSATNWFMTLPLAQQITLFITVIGVALIVGESWLLLQMLSQQGRLLLRTERLETRLAQAGIVFGLPEQELPIAGLPIGTRAPAFSGKGLDHETISLTALRALGKPIVLIFTSPTCAPCSTLMPEVGRWQRDYANQLTVALLSRGSVEDNRAKTSEHHLLRLVIQRQDEIDKLYNVQGTPSAVLIHPDGLIDSPLAVGHENIHTLVERAASLHQVPLIPLMLPGNNHHRAALEPAIPRVGTLAPAFSLPDLNGESISLSSFLGASVLLLFWNPDCGFCKRMLSDLKAWEANPPQGAPRLLVISSGTVEENRVMGLCSPVLSNKDGNVSRLFGANGTPMAVVVDAQGRVASALTEGAPDVLALAGSVKDVPQSSRV